MAVSVWARCLRVLGAIVIAIAVSAAPDTVDAGGSASFDFGHRPLESVGSFDEIPNGVITALVQGADGFLWIGTQNGLLRFDGYRFRRFRHQDNDPHSLAGDFIFSLAVDRTGKVWVGHQVDGVSVLDPATERFTHYRHDPEAKTGIGPGNIYAIAVDRGGSVFVAADDGLVRFDAARKTFEAVVLGGDGSAPEPAERVRSMMVDREDSVWIGTQDGVLRKRAGHLAAERLLTRDGPSLAGREVVWLMQARDDSLWVGTRENGAARVNIKTGAIRWIGAEHARASELSQSWINAMAQVSDDEIWLSRYGFGIAIVDANTFAVRHLLIHDPSVPDGLSFDAAGALLVDNSGLLWVGSWGGGLQRHNPRSRAIQMLRHSPVQAGKLSYPNLLSVLELRDGRVLAGTTQNGIDIIDGRVGVVGGHRPAPGTPGALTDGVIGGMAEAEDGTLWVGTFQAGVQRLDPGSTQFRHYTRAHGLPTLQTEFVEIARDGRVFVGSGDGLLRYDPTADLFVDVPGPDGKPVRTRFNDMDEAEDGRLWFGSASGLLVLDPGSANMRQFRHDVSDPASLSGDVAANVLVDRAGNVWVNTDTGLDRYRRDAGGREWFEHVSKQLGLTDEAFGSNVLEDKLGRLWSQRVVFDPQSRRVHRLHRSDGLDVGTNWVGAAAPMRDGRLLFGGSTGLAVVDPEQFEPWSQPPQVLITDVTVDGVRQPAAALTRQLELAASQTQFAVEFALSDFSAPASNQYAYRLVGVSPDWIALDAEHRLVSFGGLWPDEYTLEIRASNRVGETSMAPAQFIIRVLPRYWQRPWFVIAISLALLLLLYAAIRRSVAKYRLREVLLQALVDERTSALRDAYARVELASRTDPMTGLGNRRSLEEAMPFLAEQVAGARRTDSGSRLLALLVIDIDDFKRVNDEFGHAAGDRVIETFAKLIRAELREGDIGVRWGGEEFLIVAQVGNASQAAQCGERLRLAVATEVFDLGEGHHIHKTCSIGFACLPFADTSHAAMSWQHVLEIADAALFEAKHDGRNRVYGYRASGALDADFIDRFRRTPWQQRGDLPITRVTAQS
jgi:diguanylate cyclase (GGDEF)-like protein